MSKDVRLDASAESGDDFIEALDRSIERYKGLMAQFQPLPDIKKHIRNQMQKADLGLAPEESGPFADALERKIAENICLEPVIESVFQMCTKMNRSPSYYELYLSNCGEKLDPNWPIKS